MFIAVFVAARHEPVARAYHGHKRAEGNKRNAAITCLARRCCNLTLAILKNNTPHDPTRQVQQPTAA